MKALTYSFLSVILIAGVSFLAISKEPEAPAPENYPPIADDESRLAMASKHHEQLDYHQADSIYREILFQSEAPKDSNVRNKLSKLMIEQGKYNEAVHLLDPKEDIHFTSSDSELAMASCIRAEALIRFGEYLRAETEVNQCKKQEAALDTPSKSLQAYSEHLHGFLYQQQGHYSLALYHFQNSLNHKRNLFGIESVEYMTSLNNVGNVYYRLGEYDKAIEKHLSVLSTRERLLPKSHPSIGGTYGNLGNVYQAMGRHFKALEHHKQALGIWIYSFGPEHIESAYSHNNIAFAYLGLQEFEKAENHLIEAKMIKKAVLSSRHLSYFSTLQLLAQSYRGQGRLSDALEIIIEIEDEISGLDFRSHPKYWEVIATVAHIRFEIGDSKSAIVKMKNAVEGSLALGSPSVPKLLNDLAEFYLGSNQTDLALRTIQQAVGVNTIFEKPQINSGNPPLESGKDLIELSRSLKLKGVILSGLGYSSNQINQLKKSLSAFQRALEISSYARRNNLDSQSKAISVKHTNEIINHALRLSHNLLDSTRSFQYLDYLFYFSEFQKNGSFIEATVASKAKKIAHIPDSLVRKELDLQNLITGFDRQLLHLFENRNNAGNETSLNYQRFIARKKLSQLSSHIEQVYPRYYTLKHDVKYSNINDILEYIKLTQKTIIQYYSFDNELHAIIIENSGAESIYIGPLDDIIKTADNLRILSGPSFDQTYFNILYKIYHLIFNPLEDYIQTKSVIIFPVSHLHYVPFDALLTEPVDISIDPNQYAKNFPFLGKQININHGYSATLMLQQSDIKLKEYDKELLAMGPVFDQETIPSDTVLDFITDNSSESYKGQVNIESLDGTLRELEDLSDLIDSRFGWFSNATNDKTTVLLRGDASESNFKNAVLSDYRYIHFATHSFVNTENPINSGILLEPNGSNGEDGILYASEILGLEVPAELVVLSSCDSAMEGSGQSSGLSGFSRGFIYAGAKNLVASLWPSDDVATHLLMQQFYANMTSGQSIGTSLRNAKKAIMNTPGPISHPYYWSGFIHIGPPA